MQPSKNTSNDPDTIDSLRAQILGRQLNAMEEHLQMLDRSIEALQEERRNLLKWGIIALGSGLVGVVGWIVNLFAGGHFK